MNRSERRDELARRLTAAFDPVHLSVEDESHLHAGHAGAEDGRSHFRVHIVSRAFAGLTAVARHQRIYAAAGDLLRTDIHALAIEARVPEPPTG